MSADRIPWVELAKVVIREACTPDGIHFPPAELEEWLDALARAPDENRDG